MCGSEAVACGSRETEEVKDGQYGKGRHGDELPEEVRFKQTRLSRIKETKEVPEREAREQAQRERIEQEKKR